MNSKTVQAKPLAFLGFAFSTLLGVQDVHASCQGNACNVVSVTIVGGCVRVTNNGTSRVQFHAGVGHAPLILPGQTVTLLSPGAAFSGTQQCMKNIDGWSATYQ